MWRSMCTNDDVAQQARSFGIGGRVVDEQSLGTDQNDQSDCFSSFSYTHWREVPKFDNVSRPESDRSSVIDFQII
jgi:hypothetical protein